MIAIVLWRGGLLHEQGVLTAGELTSFIILSVQLGFSAIGIGPNVAAIISALGASQKVFELMDRQPCIPPSILPKDFSETSPINRGKIEFRKVDFH